MQCEIILNVIMKNVPVDDELSCASELLRNRYSARPGTIYCEMKVDGRTAAALPKLSLVDDDGLEALAACQVAQEAAPSRKMGIYITTHGDKSGPFVGIQAVKNCLYYLCSEYRISKINLSWCFSGGEQTNSGYGQDICTHLLPLNSRVDGLLVAAYSDVFKKSPEPATKEKPVYLHEIKGGKLTPHTYIQGTQQLHPDAPSQKNLELLQKGGNPFSHAAAHPDVHQNLTTAMRYLKLKKIWKIKDGQVIPSSVAEYSDHAVIREMYTDYQHVFNATMSGGYHPFRILL